MTTEFEQAIQCWSQDNPLYADLADAKTQIREKRMELASAEWECLRGVLLGYTLKEIAKGRGVGLKAVTSCLTEFVYPYVEQLYQNRTEDKSWCLAEQAPRFRDRYVRRLLRDLGYRPDQPIQREEVGVPSLLPTRIQPTPNASSSYWGYVEKDAPCFGRDKELAELKRRILDEQRRIIVIRGLQPSVGTTTLACKLAQTLEAESGYRVFWFPMEEAPPLEVFIRQISQLWAPHLDRSNLSSEEAFRQLLQHTGESPWLIVLDGIVPQRNSEKSYATYDEYSQLFNPIQAEVHQGCLLMTGSKHIEHLQFLQNRSRRAYGISGIPPLGGLSLEAVQEWLNSQSITSPNLSDYKAIHDAYSGNPSFIQFVIGAIQINYMGDLAKFSKEQGHTIFRNLPMMNLVREQWQGLEEVEQQICIQMTKTKQSKPLSLNELDKLMQDIVSRGELMGLLPDMQEAKFIKAIHQNEDEPIQYELTPLIQRFIAKYLKN